MSMRASVLTYVGGAYEVTGADRLWLTRAVEAEGPPQLGVAQALVSGFCCMRAKRRWRLSLGEWVRAYAQPVNPRWYEGGDLFELSLRLKTPEERVLAVKQAFAREKKHSVRSQFSSHVVAAVQLALSTTFQSDITDYAAYGVDASHKGYESRSTPLRGLNRMWTRSPGWTGYSAEEVAPGLA